MGKASSSKKVARAARTGGGSTRRGGSSSWLWPAVIVFVVMIGTATIAFSKMDQAAEASPPKRGDHWHAALGIDVCGEFLPAITDQNDPAGIHTHGDGVIHIHPNSATAEGDRATLGKYFEAVKAKVTDSEISLPGQPTKKSGMKCGDKEAEIRTKIWSSRAPDARERVVTGNPSDIQFTTDGELITIALLPSDADIPKPPSADQLDKLTDMPNANPTASSLPTPTPDGSVPPSETPGEPAPPAEPAPTEPPATEAPAGAPPPPAP